MKLIIFSQHFWPEIFRINYVVEELISKGNQINVVTGLPNYPTGEIPIEYNFKKLTVLNEYRSKVFRVPIIPRKKSTHLNIILNYLSFVFGYFKNCKKIKNEIKGDAILVYATSPFIQCLGALHLAKKLKVPLIIWIQDLWPESISDTGFIKNKYLLNIIRIFVNYIYKKTDLLLIQSEAFKYSIPKKFHSKIRVHLNPSEFNKTHETTLDNKKFTFTYTGNIGKAQNINNFLLIGNIIKSNNYNANIEIYGDGSDKENLINLIRVNELEKVINVNDRVDKEGLKKILSKSNCLLLTLASGEVLNLTIPAKFQTYLSFAKPLLVIHSGILGDIVNNNKLGFAINNGQSKLLKQYVYKLINMNIDEYSKFSKNCKNYFDNHCKLSNNIDQLINKLSEIKK